jgi:hypothetical protein
MYGYKINPPLSRFHRALALLLSDIIRKMFCDIIEIIP